jgi:sarcosine oxidase subunit alpha
VRMVDHLRNIETLCEVTDPVAFDPEGGRLRG